jgi:hypothetical protein
MIKIIFLNRKTVKKVGKFLSLRLSERYLSETVHNTIWFQGLYLIISTHSITIDVFSDDFISENDLKDILKQSLKDEHPYILCYNGLQYYVDDYNANENLLQIL